MPLGDVIVGLPEKPNELCTAGYEVRHPVGAVSAMRERLGTGTGIVGINRSSTSWNSAASRPEKSSRSW